MITKYKPFKLPEGGSMVSFMYWLSDYWPKVESSKVFVLEAVNLVGETEFGEEWTGDELKAVIGRPEPLSAYKAGLTKQITALEKSKFVQFPTSVLDTSAKYMKPLESDFERTKADELSNLRQLLDNPPQNILNEQADWESDGPKVARLRRVAEWIGTRARDGKLIGYYQCPGEPEVYALPAADWNCRDDLSGWLLTAGKKIKHPAFSASDPKPVDATFFLCRESLERERGAGALPTLPNASQLEGLHLSPYMQVMLYVIETEGINPDHQSSVEQLIEAIKEAAPKFGLEVSSDDLSARLLKAMPTIMREKSSRKGGANKKR